LLDNCTTNILYQEYSRYAKLIANLKRNQEIVRRYLAGERAVDLAKEFGITVRRVNRLIRRYLDRGHE
jgi:hypothetical protein